MAELPEGWILPSVVLYVAAVDSSGRSDVKSFARDLKAVSRRASLDGLRADMVWRSGPSDPGTTDVRPGLIRLAGYARSAPMPRLLYVARFCDLAAGRGSFVKTLKLLLDANFAVRACDGLLAADGRSLDAFRSPDHSVANAPAIRSCAPGRSRTVVASAKRTATKSPPTVAGEA